MENAPKKRRFGCFLGLLIPLGVGLMLWFFIFGPKLKHDRLVEHGIHAPGRLLTVEETGTYVNDSPELEMKVAFTRRDGTPDTAMTKFIPSLRSLHMFQEGVSVTVAYDSTDPHELTIVDLSTSSPNVIMQQPDAAAPSPGAPPPGASNPDAAAKATSDSLRRVIDSLNAALRTTKKRTR